MATRREPDRTAADREEARATRRYEIHRHLAEDIREAQRRADSMARLESRLASGQLRKKRRRGRWFAGKSWSGRP